MSLILIQVCDSGAVSLRHELARRASRDELCILSLGGGEEMIGFTFREDGRIKDLNSGRHQQQHELWALNLAPNGLAFVGLLEQGGAVVVDFNQRILSTLKADIWAPQVAISPDGTNFAFIGMYKPPGTGKFATDQNKALWSYGIHFATMGTPESTTLLVPAPESVRSAKGPGARGAWGAMRDTVLSWSGDNRQLVYDLAGKIYSYDPAKRSIAVLGNGQHPQCSPDGKWIAFQSSEGASALMDIKGGRQIVLMDGRKIRYGLKWSPDSQYLLFDEDASWLDRITKFAFTRFSVFRMNDGEVLPVYWSFDNISVRNYGWAYCPAARSREN